MTPPRIGNNNKPITMNYRSHVKVHDAGPDDLNTVRDLLVEAFLHTTIGTWLIPHVDTRYRAFQRYFEMHADHAIEFGHVHITDDASAVALWHTVTGGQQPPIDDYDARLKEITGKSCHRFQQLDRAMNENHPPEHWHQHLAFLAVHPEYQHAGRSSKLLTHHQAELDQAGTPAFVHAPGVQCRQLFIRHGYKPRLPYQLTPGDPLLYPLWRPSAAQPTPN